jgi:NifU-like protein
LAEKIVGKKLTEVHALDEMRTEIASELGTFSAHRANCLTICLEALNRAFADFRSFYIEEFAGEKALICTCFGVSEETIEKIIRENEGATVETVGEVCSAGTGCGACRFLILELIEVESSEIRR